jgi:phosphoglycolate phosphatase-like HAD superfamily hydrolase
VVEVKDFERLGDKLVTAYGLLRARPIMVSLPGVRHSAAAIARPQWRPVLPLPKALVCDLDGTLIDTMPILADLAQDVMAELYGTPRPQAREMYIATCGLPFAQQLAAIYPGDERNAVASDLFEGRKPERCARVRMTPDTIRALMTLRSQGVRLVVSSNNGTENVARFAALHQDVLSFDLALGFGEGICKGGPHLDRVAAEWGFARADMVFVGDSLHDGDIGQREKVAFVGVAGTFSREHFQLRFPHAPIVSRFSELPDLF